jgi:hypothetical protein
MGCRRLLGVWGCLHMCVWLVVVLLSAADGSGLACILKRVAGNEPKSGSLVVLLACVCRSGCLTVQWVHQSIHQRCRPVWPGFPAGTLPLPKGEGVLVPGRMFSAGRKCGLSRQHSPVAAFLGV